MFGVNSYYIQEKIVFALLKKDENAEDNGIWVASKIENHQKLHHKIKGLRAIKTYGIKTWLVLPEDYELFEEQANAIADLIKTGSELIGNIPKQKRR